MIKLTQAIYDLDAKSYILIDDLWVNPKHVSAIAVKNQMEVSMSYIQVRDSSYLVLGSPAEIREKLRV